MWIYGDGSTKCHTERLRREMVRDLGEEEGKYQVFCVTIGRKPGLGNGD